MKELEERNWELIEARDSALSAVRIKAEFLSNMSHEIRTPLNGVIGMAEVLSYTSLDAHQQSFVQTIRQSAQGLLGIINDILDFSKLEAGKLTLETISFSLRDVIEDSAALLATIAHEKGLDVCCALPPLGTALACITDQLLGDATRLKHIVTNLLSNAIKFTEHGEITLGAELLQETPYNARWRVFVRDTGIGIPVERQEAIFESFTQADGSTTRRFGGTGLGLTISRQLTNQMGGQLTLVSEVGKGSEFRVDITFQKQTMLMSTNMPELELTSGQKVFVVDNNAVCRSILQDMLSAWGYSVTTAQNGREALEILQHNTLHGPPPDLILLDMLMPEMNGLAFMQQLKQSPQLASIPVCLLCPIGASGVVEAMSDPAFVACLCKPVRQSELGNLLRRDSTGQEDVSWFTLPVEAQDTETLPDIAQAKPALRILLAEDVIVNQMVACEMLKQCGILPDAITTVANGQEALEALARETFDLILMDLYMPEMGGWETVAVIRAREKEAGSRRIPIIAMTALASPEDREACFVADMDDYISKPLERMVLSARIEHWMNVLQEGIPFQQEGNPFQKEELSKEVFSKESPSAADLYTEAAPIPLQTINVDRLQAATGGDKALEQAILREFQKIIPNRLIRCGLAIEIMDGPGLEHWAHSLKGSSQTIGAEQFAELCQKLESIGKENDMTQGVETLARLQEVWRQLDQCIQDRLKIGL